MGQSLLSPEIAAYIDRTWVRESPLLAELRAETAAVPKAHMQISAEEGALISLLVKMLNAKKGLEIGVFTGYSSVVTALALPPDGRLIACDVSEEFTSMARRYWDRAGVAEKIDLRIAPAVETLQRLVDDGEAGTFDFAFIDADKPSYPKYFEFALKLVKVGGLIAIDNVLWSGKVADPSVTDEETEVLRALNEKLRGDERIELALAPVGDGLTLALKR